MQLQVLSRRFVRYKIQQLCIKPVHCQLTVRLIDSYDMTVNTELEVCSEIDSSEIFHGKIKGRIARADERRAAPPRLELQLVLKATREICRVERRL